MKSFKFQTRLMSIAKKALLFTSALALLAGQSATASMRLSGAGASLPIC